ncbi:MAG: cytidine deaminase [Treponema sp.]|nr:cytidine deaminase [Treponema sp.]
MLDTQTQKKLFAAAKDMLNFSYVPYSKFTVGAALLTKDDKIYTGCNIENAAYGPTNCAERTAFFKAVSEGILKFKAIMVVGGPEGVIKDYCPPCGVCRQVMMEFCNPDEFEIYLAKSEDDIIVYKLKELLPLGFGNADLNK